MAAERTVSALARVDRADGHLELRFSGEGERAAAGVWVSLDDLARRTGEGGPLLRACGIRRGQRPSVLDPMAGLGVDGLVLASHGCRVTLVERHPLLWELLQDLVRRSALDDVTCCLGDGFAHLGTTARYDVIYLDPMFPARSKRALPAKRMQWLARVAEPDARPLESWLDAAVVSAMGRVVLKRRRKDPMVRKPDWQILGRSVRFDVYRGTG